MSQYTASIQQLYVAYFGRPADPIGLQFWETQVAAANGSTAAVSSAFSKSAEYTSAFNGMGAAQTVNQIYLNLFGRPADTSGLLLWAGKYSTGELTIANIVTAIGAGAQGSDLVAFNNKTTAAVNFTVALDTSAEIVNYNAASLPLAKAFIASITADITPATGAALDTTVAAVTAAGAPIPPVTIAALTTGVDTLVGTTGNDVFNATGTTFTSLDTINGGAGVNSLIIQDAVGNQGSGVPALVTVTNMQNVSVTTVGTVGNVASAGVAATPEQKTYTFSVPAAGTDTISFSINGVTVTTGQLGATAITAATAFANALNAAAGTTVATTGGTAVVTVVGPTTGATYPITFTGATASADFPAVVTSVTGVASTAASSAAIYDVSGFGGLTNFTVSANGTVNTKVADTTAVNLTTTKGSVTVAGGTVITSTGATGAEVFTGGAITSVTATGGTTVNASDVVAGTSNATLTTVSLSGNTGLATLTGDALATVNLAKSAAGATIVNTTAKHVLNLGVNAVTANAVITDTAATTVNLTVTGAKASTASAIDLTMAKASTLNITNSATLTLTTAGGLAAADVLTAVTVKGAGTTNADFTGVLPLVSIDASGSTGKNTFVIDSIAGLTYKGGTGADKVTVNGTLDAKAVINLGDGNDTFVVSGLATAGAQVIGGAGNDTLAIADAANLTSAATGVYTGFETLSVSGGKGIYDMSILSLTAVTDAVALAAAVTINNAAAGTTVGFTSAAGATLTTTNDFTYVLKDATGKADAVAISLTATDGTSDGVASGAVVLSKFIALGVENVSISSNIAALDVDDTTTTADESTVANQYTNTVTLLQVNDATTLTLTGSANLTFGGINSTTLTRIDASAATGNITFLAAEHVNGGGAGVTSITYLGGSGVDTYIASANGDLISGGAGADIITLGAGKDTLSYTKASDSILTLKDTSTPLDGISDTAKGFDTITGFTSTSDKIDISSLALATGAGRGALTLLTLSADTAAGLQSLIGTGVKFFNDGVANREVAYATGAGAGYVFIDTNGDGNYTAGTDMVIKLVGAPALVVTDIAFG